MHPAEIKTAPVSAQSAESEAGAEGRAGGGAGVAAGPPCSPQPIKFSDNAADKSLVPLYRKSLYITLNHAFEAFDSFKQQQEQEQAQQ